MARRFSDLSSRSTVLEAAELVLGSSLSALTDEVSLERANPGADPEHVHQIRVHSRRAAAALLAFSDSLPSEPTATLSRRLRRLRKSAGEARDLDVWSAELRKRRSATKGKQRRAIDFLLRRLRKSRRTAQKALDRTLRKIDVAALREWAEQSIRSRTGQSDQGAEFRGLAQARLKEAADELFRLHSQARPTSWKSLHAIRIAGKRLRYCMDIFRPCFAGSNYEELYRRLKALQELLGTMNDDRGFADRIKALLRDDPEIGRKTRTGMRALRRHYRHQAADRPTFVEFWDRNIGETFRDRLLALIDENHATIDLVAKPHSG